MLKLTPAEQTWLDEYRETLAKDYPGLVEDIIIYGPTLGASPIRTSSSACSC